MTLRKIAPGDRVETTYKMSEVGGHEFLQSLVNALVEAGFKPDEIKASDKEVTAIKAHLQDMGALVFNKEIKL